jgi:3-oxoadipate enol-lactonase
VLRDTNLRSSISAIRVQTAIVAGTYDLATTTADARFLKEQISGAQYIELPAAHLSNVESSARFTEEVSRFLTA